MAMKSPLKWVGSKSRIIPQLLRHLPKGKRLVEPFAGSCSVMLNTDYDEYLIADVNPDLIHLYQYIQLDVEQLIEDARRYFDECNSPEWFYQLRASFNIESEWQQRATLFLYLNRHCYGGVCRYNQRGNFNAPYGHYKRPYFPEKELMAFAEKAKRATFICASYDETLKMVSTGDVVYCDPPYIPVTSTANFTQYHTDGFCALDQEYLAAMLYALSRKDIPVIASNSDTPQARSLYHLFTQHKLKAPRSIGAANGAGSSAAELLAIRAG